jgi:hypothetical protein
MVTLEESAAALGNAGFVEVDIRDRHASWCSCWPAVNFGRVI